MTTRAYIFVWNNPRLNPAELIKKFEEFQYTRYVVFQREIGEQKTEHYQGYLELNRPCRITQLKKAIAEEIHWEIRRGTRNQARDYCRKEDTRVDGPYEFGDFDMGGQGNRTDLSELRDTVLNKIMSIEQIVSNIGNYTHLKFVEGLQKYVKLSKDFRVKQVYWFWGSTGQGKTKAAYDIVGDNFWVATTSQWFDGYYGQEDVIIDELRAVEWPYRKMLRLLDGYEMRVPVKGGFVIWNPKRVVITTPLSPENTYPLTHLNMDGGIDQLLRRITEIKLFGPEPIHTYKDNVGNVIYQEFE